MLVLSISSLLLRNGYYMYSNNYGECSFHFYGNAIVSNIVQHNSTYVKNVLRQKLREFDKNIIAYQYNFAWGIRKVIIFVKVMCV